MLSTIIYLVALIAITAAYIWSCRKIRNHWAEMMAKCITKNDESLKWWHRKYDCLEKEKDELAVKLCEAEMWCEVGYPDEGERVLVCSVTKKGEKRINIAYYKDGSWHGNGNLDNVIAWKTLPELPEFEDPAEGGAE